MAPSGFYKGDSMPDPSTLTIEEFGSELVYSEENQQWNLDDDIGVDVFPSADAIMMILNGAIQAPVPRGGVIPGVRNGQQIVAVYITAATGIWIGIRSKTW